MRSFLKIFLACLTALLIFCFIGIFILVRIAASNKINVAPRSVLVINLGLQFKEQVQHDPLAMLSSDEEKDIPGLYDMIRLIKYAKTDHKIEGIYVQASPSPNGFAASDEIRNALLDFKTSGKFIIAHADVMTQHSYAIANIADKVYVSPQGGLEWTGYSVEYAFLKGTLEKLEVEPQIFYAGKFKSATEPLRATQMTDENRLQTTIWLNDLYTDLLVKTAAARKLDTAVLRQLAAQATIRSAQDAVQHQLIDGVKYDDEVKDEIKQRLKLDKYQRIEFMSINTYREAVSYAKSSGEKIAMIYAEGDIIDGKGDNGTIGGQTYSALVRSARLDRSVKAIVFRINSGGGSAMASENIWRELALAKKEKPVIVSFGDVAASGGYYVACAADSIFAMPTTITGSIGVFGIIPNMQAFFNHKLGVTFDGVKTGPYADGMTITRPMTDAEKNIIQAEIESIYALFKKRVAEGRGRDTAYIDSIAQGRVWTGLRAKDIGLIDRFGGVEDAVKAAASKAGLTDYQVKEYPESKTFIEELLGTSSAPVSYAQKMKEEMGADYYQLYQQLKKIRQMTNTVQARMPFEMYVRKDAGFR